MVRVGFRQFRTTRIVCVTGRLILSVSKGSQLTQSGVSEIRGRVDSVGSRFASIPGIERDERMFVLGIGLLDGISRFVIFGFGNRCCGIGPLGVSTERIIDHVSANIVGVSNGQLVSACIVGHDRGVSSLIDRSEGSTCAISPRLGSRANWIDILKN
jgi:hypothetical protein